MRPEYFSFRAGVARAKTNLRKVFADPRPLLPPALRGFACASMALILGAMGVAIFITRSSYELTSCSRDADLSQFRYEWSVPQSPKASFRSKAERYLNDGVSNIPVVSE